MMFVNILAAMFTHKLTWWHNVSDSS